MDDKMCVIVSPDGHITIYHDRPQWVTQEGGCASCSFGEKNPWWTEYNKLRWDWNHGR